MTQAISSVASGSGAANAMLTQLSGLATPTLASPAH
jgi:hypothetical protein